jgi:pectin methylesterase-like acyl-CoA thioesterase
MIPRKLLATGLAGLATLTGTSAGVTSAQAALAITVAADGSGTVRTVQAAVDLVPAGN